MKIIDEQGRLFGKINIIDFLVVLFLLGILPMFYFGFKIFRKPELQIALPQKIMPLDVYFRINNLTPEELNRIAVGDILIGYAGNNIGEILSIGQPAIYSYNVDLGSSSIVSYQDPERRQVLIKARVLGEVKNNAFYYNGEKIAIGSRIQLKTDKYSMEGQVDSETKAFFVELVEMHINLKPLQQGEVKHIAVGDVFIDDTGNNIGEILSVNEPMIYSYNIDLGNNSIVSHEDPERRQVLIKARLLGEVKNNAFYYNGEKISIGSQMRLKTNKYAVEGIVESSPKSSMPMLIEPAHVLLKIMIKDLIPEIAGIVRAGDEEKDDAGFVIKKIKSIVSSGPGENVVPFEGKLMIVSHPMNKDMVLAVEAVCTKDENKLFLNKNAIKVGSGISIKTDKYDIQGTIVEIRN